ncbi:MAG: hypothetical protein WD557_15520 [Dehalococcoidia bacterium]
MNRDQKVANLLALGPDDERRLALDELDAVARRENTWGSQEHRKGRERIESLWDVARRRVESLGDEQLDTELAAGSQT